MIEETAAPAVRAACVRVARRMHLGGNAVIGMIPAGDRVAVPPVMIQLGRALIEVTGADIALVDANVRWPGLADLRRDRVSAGDAYETAWIGGSLALLTPPRSERTGDAVPALARLLLRGCQHFTHILVDLTGFDLLGEHASAAACMDAALLVAHAGESRERHLRMHAQAIPKNCFLGVLLAGDECKV